MTNNISSSLIELNTFVKLKGFASTGGQAKRLIRSGAVMVNEEVETRNKKKLYQGDSVVIEGKDFIVSKDELY